MNRHVLDMKQMTKAMQSYVLLLYEIVLESKPELILEIGTGQCQSTRTMLSALEENKKGKLVSIDLSDRSSRIPKELLQYFCQIVGNSHYVDIFQGIKNEFKDRFDILFIDGDHTYEGVKQDFEMYSSLVKDRGLILIHDITSINTGVKKFWEEIKYPKVGLEYGKAAGGIIPGMGILQKPSRAEKLIII